MRQNPAVLVVIKHSFTTVPGVSWVITAVVLYTRPGRNAGFFLATCGIKM